MKRFLVMMLLAASVVSAPFVNVSYDNTVMAATVSTEGKTNLVKNGDFNNGIKDWGYFTAEGGKGSIECSNGALKATIKNCGDVAYGLQVYNQSFPLYKGGKYVLKFDISSSVSRTVEAMIQIDGGDYHSYTWKKLSTSPSKQSVVMEFTMKDDTDLVPKLCFNMGNEEDDPALPEHNVTIDNVGLYLVDDSSVNYNTGDKKEEEKIILNQLGYLPNSFKEVVFRGNVTDKEFKVVSKDTNKVVYTGTISGHKYNNSAREDDYYGDFSSVTTPGTYKITTASLGESYEFKIGDDVYKDVLDDAQKFFYMQRCGEELPESYAGKWAHPACHKSLAKIYGTNERIDVSGGWHDAGDYGRYVVATSKSAADLMLAYNSNKAIFTDNIGIPESGNGTADILDEVKGQLKWLFKMQNKNNGGVYHKVTCADFPGFVMPQFETAELIVCPVTTTATADFAAVMAMGYETFKDIDKNLADQCLSAAEKAYTYLESAPSQVIKNPEGIVTGEYGDTSDRDERYWAAAQLFKATGKSKYHNKIKEMVNQKVELGYDWALVGNYGNEAYLAAKGADENTKKKIQEAIIKEADRIVSASKSDGYGIANGSIFYWGSNMAILNESVVLQVANSISPKEDYVKYAREHVNYCFGKNANAMSFVTGYGTVTPQHPHHRPSVKMEAAIPGMIIGGVNSGLEDKYAEVYLKDAPPAKCYIDNDQSYSTNEVDIYWNSTLVHALSRTSMVAGSSQGGNQGTEEGGNQGGNQGTEEGGNQGGNQGGSGSTDTPTTSDKLDVKVTTNIDSTTMRQRYEITAKESVDLSKVGIRFYFTKSDNKPMQANCYNAALNLKTAPWYSDVTSSAVAKVGSDAKGTYVEYRVNKAMTLNNDGSILSLDTAVSNTDWSGIKVTEKGVEVVFYN